MAKNPPPNGPAYRRVGREDQDQALAVLLTGSTDHAGGRVGDFLRLAGQQKIDLQNLWACYHGADPTAAVLLVPSAGRTAMGFISPLTDPELVGYSGELMRRACAGQDAATTQLIQVLLEPTQELEARALVASGFTRLAELVYMRRSTEPIANSQPLSPNLQLLGWTESRRPLFAQAILRSYEQTLDCPGLLGVRHIDDILAGHLAAGRFVPGLWHILLENNEPVGVVLVNLVADGSLSELVYFGLAPSMRGRGIAEGLVRFGLDAAHAHGSKQILLAVDKNNQPALRLYRRVGFTPETRKVAMIFTLN